MLMKRMMLASAAASVLFFALAAYTYYGDRSEPEQQNTPQALRLLDDGREAAMLRMTVLENGVYALDEQTARRAQFPLDQLDDRSLRLTRDGRPVAFTIAKTRTGETNLYFYGEAVTRTVDAPAVYMLSRESGITMQSRDAAPGASASDIGRLKFAWEENSHYLTVASSGDVWLGPQLWGGTAFTLPLRDLRPTGAGGTLRVTLWSNNRAEADPDHHMRVLLNGSLIADEYWDGITSKVIESDIEAGVLQPNQNALLLDVPGDTGAAGEAIYIDRVELSYDGLLVFAPPALTFFSDAETVLVREAPRDPLILDITDPLQPELLRDWEFDDGELRFRNTGGERRFVVVAADAALTPSVTVAPQWNSLRDGDHGADYIAIVPHDGAFERALTPLLDYRRGQGMAVEMIAVEQIFDEFAHGRATPDAIRDFIRFAVESWQPPPRFVLLVGDASYDSLRLAEDSTNRDVVPTYQIFTEYAGYVASDTWFTLDAQTQMPIVAIGRFPVQTASELTTLVEKTIAYENVSENGGEWRGRALLVADDEAYFNVASDELADKLSGSGFANQKLYMTENENIHDAIISAVNQGIGILNYVGHGGVRVWGDERVLQVEDSADLINGSRLPIFTTFTCLNGFFNHPTEDALAESLLLANRGGIVAAVAPSGRSTTSQQTPLADVFFEQLLTGASPTVGEALQASKTAGADDAYLSDVIHTFNLLGDPALRFNLP